MKTCTKCGDTKPLDGFYCRNGRLVSPCKACKRRTTAEWKAKNHEAVKAKRRLNYKKRASEINRARSERLASDPEFRARRSETNRRYREKNKEAIAAHFRDRRANQTPAERKALNEYMRAYRKANPDIDWNKRQRKRAARQPGRVVRRQEIWERDNGTCRLCGKKIDGDYHIDHIVPLALGGTHEPANCQLAHPACNQEKWIKLEGQIHLPIG